MTPPISVAVATRNYGKYLRETLDSVLAQSWADWECVVIDDGSTDDTPEVIRPYLNDQRFRYHRTEGLGQSRAKNLCWRLSRAPLVAYIDADDAWLPTKLERQLRLFREKPNLGLVHARRSFIGPDGEHVCRPCAEPTRGRCLDGMVIQNSVCFSSVMIRRDVLEHIGGFNPSQDLAIDYDLWLRLTRDYEIDFVDEALVRYRTGHANLSSRTSERVGVAVAVQRRFLDRWGNGEATSREAVDRAWASTWRTAGYLRRAEDVIEALGCYGRALRYRHQRGQTIRSIGAALALAGIKLLRLR